MYDPKQELKSLEDTFNKLAEVDIELGVAYRKALDNRGKNPTAFALAYELPTIIKHVVHARNRLAKLRYRR